MTQNELTAPQAKNNWGWFLTLGIILVAMGTLAVAVPVPFTLAADLVLGWVLVVAGVAQLIHAFKSHDKGNLVWHALVGLIYCLTGVLVLVHPLMAAVSITLILAIALIFDGISRGILALRLRSFPNWKWMLLSAALSLILGLLILAQWPSAALWVIGVMVGISLIFNGWSLIMISSNARRLP